MSRTLFAFFAQDNQPPASAYATLDERNAHLVLDFDGSTDEEAVFVGRMPLEYSGGNITVDLYVAATTATSGTNRWQGSFERINAGGLDIDADSFATALSVGNTTSGTSGVLSIAQLVFTNAEADGIQAGEPFRFKVRRDADGTTGTDDITTDCELYLVAGYEA